MKTDAQLKAEIRSTLARNVTDLESAVANSLGGFIFAWPKYGLGVLIEKDGPRVVRADLATIVRHDDGRVFNNGANLPALILDRNEVLRQALEQARASLASIPA